MSNTDLTKIIIMLFIYTFVYKLICFVLIKIA